ncbi:MAG: TIR domain-containing protein [Promethearchaeota archaeon]
MFKCDACGSQFDQENSKTAKFDFKQNLCSLCTFNFTEKPNFKAILFGIAIGIYFDKLGYKKPEIALQKAYNYIQNLPYWRDKSDQINPMQNLIDEFSTFLIGCNLSSKIDTQIEKLSIQEEKYDIFISHSWNGPDTELVEPLVKKLKQMDYNIWFDKDLGLKPGDIKDYLQNAIINSKFCIPILCKPYFQGKNTIFELQNILKLKQNKKYIIPIWWSDIDTKFIQQQELGDEILKCSSITWKNAGQNIIAIAEKIDEFIDLAQDILEYNGVKLFERDANVLKSLEKNIGETIPDITQKLIEHLNAHNSNILDDSESFFGFAHENQHLIGLFLTKTADGRQIQPLDLPKDAFKLATLKYLHIPLINLPPQINNLTNLIELDTSNGIVSELPDLSALKNLKKFKFKNCGIIKANEKAIKFWIKFLNFRQYKGLDMHESFFLNVLLQEMGLIYKDVDYDSDYGKITQIVIKKKSIEFLPETISSLKNLRKLDISWNKLSSLPESIGNLINLRKLDISWKLE